MLTRPDEAAEVAEERKAAFAILGSALIPALSIAMTNGDDKAVPSARPSARSS